MAGVGEHYAGDDYVVQRYNRSDNSYAYRFWITVNETNYNPSTNTSSVTYTFWFDNNTSYNDYFWSGYSSGQPTVKYYINGTERASGYVRSEASAYNPAAGKNYQIGSAWSTTHAHAADGTLSVTGGVAVTAATAGGYCTNYGPKTSSNTTFWTMSTAGGHYTLPKVVYYNANGGGSTPATQYSAGSAITLAAAISKSSSVSTTNFNISYNANGGNSTPSTQTGTKTVTTPYSFNGWHENSATGTSHSASSSFTPSANVTMYAGWNTGTASTTYKSITVASAITRNTSTDATYTISYNLNGGTSTVPGNQTSRKTTTYTFNSWKDNNNGTHTAGSTWAPTAANTLTAAWNTVVATERITLPAAPTQPGYKFNGWYTATSGGTKRGNAGDTYYPTQSETLYAQWTAIDYTVTIVPNGGTYGGSTGTTTLSSKHINDVITISEPTRPGYTFLGWVKNGAGALSKYTNTDPIFQSGTGGVGVYNNSSNGAVTHTRVTTGATDTATFGNYDIKIDVANNTTSPGLGGFVQTTTSAASKKFIHFFCAKIPTGYSVQWAANAGGDGRTVTWLTSTAGTGGYSFYAYQYNCGSTGTFSTFGHVYILSGTKPMTWYLASSSMWDITNGKSDTLTMGAGNCRLVALWAANTYTLTFNANGGTVSPSTKSVTYGTSYTDLPKPTRPGYIFRGWFANCANSAGSAINFGREYKYVSKLNIHFVTYSTDYSGWGSYRIISCTEGGGWNIENNGGKIRFQVYDNTGGAYNPLDTTTTWASLKAGFHQWDIILNNKVITLYLDGTSIGTVTLAGANIRYHAVNSIFVGGEATSSESAASSPYLNGYVGNITISDSTTRITDLGRQRFTAPAQNVTLYALWEPYFNVYIKGQTSGWVLLKNGYNWQN